MNNNDDSWRTIPFEERLKEFMKESKEIQRDIRNRRDEKVRGKPKKVCKRGLED